MIVRFTDPNEFCQEVTARGPNLEPIVRVTHFLENDPDIAAVKRYFVIATYLRGLPDGRTVIVTLRKYIGQRLEHARVPPDQVIARAERIIAEVRATCDTMPLGVAAGVYATGIEEPAP